MANLRSEMDGNRIRKRRETNGNYRKGEPELWRVEEKNSAGENRGHDINDKQKRR